MVESGDTNVADAKGSTEATPEGDDWNASIDKPILRAATTGGTSPGSILKRTVTARLRTSA